MGQCEEGEDWGRKKLAGGTQPIWSWGTGILNAIILRPSLGQSSEAINLFGGLLNLGFEVSGLGSEVSCLGSEVLRLGYTAKLARPPPQAINSFGGLLNLGFEVLDLGYEVLGLGSEVLRLGYTAKLAQTAAPGD